MNTLLIPFLCTDAVLIWMLRDTIRTGEVWLATRMGTKGDNKAIWWMTVLRLVGLLVLSLVGTIAATLA